MSVPSQHTSPVPPARADSAADSVPRTASTKEQGESFDELLTWAYTAAGERLHRVGERLRALPAWLSVLLIYGLSRVWGFIVFAVVGQQQLRSPWGQHLDYLSFISIWDAGWYEQIAVQGYPSELPVNAAGVVQQNQWAFYPIFPQLSGAISHATGIGYYPVAATVALIAGFAAAWVIYLLFEASLKATGFKLSLIHI